jgi:membrane protease YdiL (CAAX protease family)
MRPALVDRVERDHRQPDREFVRRRVVVTLTLVVGATLLGISLNVPPDGAAFYPLTLALAATWVVGGFVSGPLHLGRIRFRGELRRPVIIPILLGLAAAALFIVGAVVVREIDPLRAMTESVLAFARYGSLPLVALIMLVNGVAEEIFFRGALFAAVGLRHPVAISTTVYALTTVTTGNPMLVFAAVLLGLLLGLQRRASGGILGPILTHCTWSLTMLLVLPPVFAAAG